jgi:hypothetical protein
MQHGNMVYTARYKTYCDNSKRKIIDKYKCRSFCLKYTDRKKCPNEQFVRIFDDLTERFGRNVHNNKILKDQIDSKNKEHPERVKDACQNDKRPYQKTENYKENYFQRKFLPLRF